MVASAPRTGHKCSGRECHARPSYLGVVGVREALIIPQCYKWSRRHRKHLSVFLCWQCQPRGNYKTSGCTGIHTKSGPVLYFYPRSCTCITGYEELSQCDGSSSWRRRLSGTFCRRLLRIILMLFGGVAVWWFDSTNGLLVACTSAGRKSAGFLHKNKTNYCPETILIDRSHGGRRLWEDIKQVKLVVQ